GEPEVGVAVADLGIGAADRGSALQHLSRAGDPAFHRAVLVPLPGAGIVDRTFTAFAERNDRLGGDRLLGLHFNVDRRAETLRGVLPIEVRSDHKGRSGGIKGTWTR